MPRNNQRINEEDTFILGDTVLFFVEFESDKVLVNPALVKIYIRRPNGSVSEYNNNNTDEVSSESKGIFQFQYTINYPGKGVIRWEGFTDIHGMQTVGASERSFTVISSSVLG